VPTDPRLASVHFQVQQAGQSLELAAAFLGGRRLFRGIEHINAAVGHLARAEATLKASGQYPALAQYVGQLVQFYRTEAAKVMRPMAAPGVGEEIAGNQGNLLAADPVLFPNVAH
jgi:hypothetical protein